MPSDKLEEAKETEKAKKEAAEEDDGELKDGDKEGEEENELVPRPLHKTYSLFIRNVSPTITKQEIISVSLSTLSPDFFNHCSSRILKLLS